MKYSRWILFFVLFFFSSTAFSQIYEWIDENGVRRYSNLLPSMDVQIIKKYDEIVIENEDIPPPKEGNTEREKIKNSPDDQKQQAVKPSENKQKVTDSTTDCQESEYIKRLKRGLDRKITSRTRRKLTRRLKAAEKKEASKCNQNK